MKTNLQFRIDSKEITEQLNEVITAEAKAEARKISKKAFDEALEKKVEQIIVKLDNDLEVDNWYHKKNEFRTHLHEIIAEELKKQFAADTSGFKNTIESLVNQKLREFMNSYNSVLAEMNRVIKKEVETQVAATVSTELTKVLLEVLVKKEN